MSDSNPRLADALEAVASGCDERADQIMSSYPAGDETATASWLSELADILRGVAMDQAA
ncbi:hypothetical protein AB0H73_05970 [Streptomyces olivoreticuli]